MVIHLPTTRLYNVDILSANGFLDFDSGFADGEFRQ